RYPQRMIACELNRRHHIGWVGAFCDEQRLAADHRVVHFAGVLIPAILTSDNLPAELSAEFIEYLRLQHGFTLWQITATPPHGKGPVCSTMVTTLPAATRCPAVGGWLNTHEFVWFAPVNFGTSPAASVVCAASFAGKFVTSGTAT